MARSGLPGGYRTATLWPTRYAGGQEPTSPVTVTVTPPRANRTQGRTNPSSLGSVSPDTTPSPTSEKWGRRRRSRKKENRPRPKDRAPTSPKPRATRKIIGPSSSDVAEHVIGAHALEHGLHLTRFRPPVNWEPPAPSLDRDRT